MRTNLDSIEFMIEFGSVCVIFEGWEFGVVRRGGKGVRGRGRVKLISPFKVSCDGPVVDFCKCGLIMRFL
jgi:hypothetical protein